MSNTNITLSHVVVIAVILGSVAIAPAGVANPAVPNDVELVATITSLTGTHEHYIQRYQGVPVLGGYYKRHETGDGSATIDDGRLALSGDVATHPTISRQTALATAKVRRASRRTRTIRAGAEFFVIAELFVIDLDSSAKLVWVVSEQSGRNTMVDATTGDVLAREIVAANATGMGRVFEPNPVVTLDDHDLVDQNDADFPALQPAYVMRDLAHLDGSGYLRGDFASVTGTGKRAFAADLRFVYGRSDGRFEQVMGYYGMTLAQDYLQSLGFANVNAEPQVMLVNTPGETDNSFYIPVQDRIKLGHGGVDDAEDLDVVWHEYAHAFQDDQAPGWGVGVDWDARSIDEGFGDYWAVTMSQQVGQTGDLVPCIADWDSTSYTTESPHCLRRVDTDLTVDDRVFGELNENRYRPWGPHEAGHHDSQIWSRALWDINQELGSTAADRIIVETNFYLVPDAMWGPTAGRMVWVADALYGPYAAEVVRAAFEARGIEPEIPAP